MIEAAIKINVSEFQMEDMVQCEECDLAKRLMKMIMEKENEYFKRTPPDRPTTDFAEFMGWGIRRGYLTIKELS